MRKNLIILFGAITFWSVLIGAAWAYLPLPLAAISAAVHSFGLVVTTAPILSAWPDCPGRLSLPGAINPFDFSPLSGATRNGKGAGNSSSLVSYSSAAVTPRHSAEWCSNFAQGEQGQPLHHSGDGVTPARNGCAWSHNAKEMGEAELKKAGFTVVCKSFSREMEAG